ncbi:MULTISPECIES: anthranilate synthase family protein [unclassified Kitasatospora]|uniref:anthranilate synthase family protein n=1 Tax=unclassified Kitasatospora TaxID=2633591 RepID=UPI0007109807|nr:MULTISPECIES: anthranilate synthase family protein [unclassified Kitasatospora]KQV15437.1 anthranilate synthase [Kitasatospora sp. Root107]KRB63975.1 anthranilate synthase [Kitasatospora sp. Root187]
MTECPVGAALLGRILAGQQPEFALLYRPVTGSPDRVDVLAGTVTELSRLADIPLAADRPATGRDEHEVLAVVPYRQIAERGFAVADDGAPLLALGVREQGSVPLAELLRQLPDLDIELVDGRYDIDDPAYADVVRRILANEIGNGEGANFVIRRAFVADISDYTPAAALTFFRRLLERERGAYWTFVIRTGIRTFVGATPERHLSLSGGVAVMNPISGTYRYPESGPTLPGVLSFLADAKEADELYMVVDEELKMLARITDAGGRVTGPHLLEMARLAHTQYFIEGETSRDPREILRETLFAPTVTGSPLESAAKVISRYEPGGRGYYSGLAALIGRDAEGGRTMDSSILIRTADISANGRLTIGVGATLVRDSRPESEVAETAAKVAGLLAALGAREPAPKQAAAPPEFAEHPYVLDALRQRNVRLAPFWLADTEQRARPVPELIGRRVLVLDAEDTFTAMWDHQLRALGLAVTVRRFDQAYSFDGYDLVVLGPGPGDPQDLTHPKIAHLHRATRQLLETGRPFLSVCLSHQVLSTVLGFDLVRRARPNQGVARTIDLFGRAERVGFYNTFAGRADQDVVELPYGTVEVSRDPATGEIHALRGPGFRSMQFHPESVLSQDGLDIIIGTLVSLLDAPARPVTEPGLPYTLLSAFEFTGT